MTRVQLTSSLPESVDLNITTQELLVLILSQPKQIDHVETSLESIAMEYLDRQVPWLGQTEIRT